MSNYTIKKELHHATGVDNFDLPAKKSFVALKAEVDKLDVNELVNVPTSLNNLKTKKYWFFWLNLYKNEALITTVM